MIPFACKTRLSACGDGRIKMLSLMLYRCYPSISHNDDNEIAIMEAPPAIPK